ncbi:MAG: DNA-directed RNA polymerase subunit omega [Candidatus Eisenbacteria bacterium]|uniref:DNA-directed RNA polymerase subunit omega n=1 Tax=Eiseniibacteriota bacterium TaxID=2212470 RepID=A0A948RTY3_UNCEI|nr:DNA-directed RNA polymerase subunit omega [Candidatus Eisenbacteria bacterium]MBU1950058.1 DNA-directed RNA polymerase subunit omega [Candidatus Eisenbacteria bacterium]MBU2689402.1 DNA-directed RNA polymerase subunit omega [Candidatus Eisenbacteria bacterium]
MSDQEAPRSKSKHVIDQESLLDPQNKYELVMTAAKEAERLNSVYNHRHEEPPMKVTSLALERVYSGLTRLTYEEEEKEETREQLPFFNPEL